jgi:hypothetical protein
MDDQPQPRPILAIVVTAVWGVLLFPGLLGAALSPMFFDAPGSMSNPVAIFNALVVVSFPILCIVSIVAVWMLWSLLTPAACRLRRRRDDRRNGGRHF